MNLDTLHSRIQEARLTKGEVDSLLSLKCFSPMFLMEIYDKAEYESLQQARRELERAKDELKRAARNLKNQSRAWYK